jgi:hypothetical protein
MGEQPVDVGPCAGRERGVLALGIAQQVIAEVVRLARDSEVERPAVTRHRTGSVRVDHPYRAVREGSQPGLVPHDLFEVGG